MTQDKKIIIGSDHAGYYTKQYIIDILSAKGYTAITDCGCDDTSPVDYPIYANNVSEEVVKNTNAVGILICGTGIGMSMAANKLPGIRAAVCHDINIAELTRQHNDANVLCLGSRVKTDGQNVSIALKWLETEFEGGRHLQRINLF